MIAGLAVTAVGALLLLTSLDVLDVGAWLGMLELWPVALVAVGVGLLLPREARSGRLAVAVAALVVLTVGGWAVSERDTALRGSNADVGIALGDAERADVDLEVAAGRWRVSAGASSGEAVTGSASLLSGQRLVADGATRGDTARVRVAAEAPWLGIGTDVTSIEPWRLGLTEDVPVHLRLTTEVGEADLDLSEILLEEARVRLGLGRVDLRLPEGGRARVRIDHGLGETVVRVPPAMPARIAIDTGVGAVDVDGAYLRDGDVYTSPGWEDAEDRLDIVIEAGLGSVRVLPTR